MDHQVISWLIVFLSSAGHFEENRDGLLMPELQTINNLLIVVEYV